MEHDVNILGIILAYGALGLVGAILVLVIVENIRTVRKTRWKEIDWRKELKGWFFAIIFLIASLLAFFAVIFILGAFIYGVVEAIRYGWPLL